MEWNGNDFDSRFKRLEDLVIRDNEEFRERFRRMQDRLDRLQVQRENNERFRRLEGKQ